MKHNRITTLKVAMKDRDEDPWLRRTHGKKVGVLFLKSRGVFTLSDGPGWYHIKSSASKMPRDSEEFYYECLKGTGGDNFWPILIVPSSYRKPENTRLLAKHQPDKYRTIIFTKCDKHEIFTEE